MSERWATRPWRLLPNRVTRFYRGGLLIDRFRQSTDPHDDDRPEDWVGSATRAWTPPGSALTDEGLGTAELDGEVRRVDEVLAEDPIGVGGAALADTGTTGILVKLLDAGIRLPVHAHPTRDFARQHLSSVFGKAEAWVVIGTRQIDDQPPPGVHLGFREEVSRDALRAMIDRQDRGALLGVLHHRPTQPGDVWFVPPGVPHAIGAGVFILEVQEPSDFSIVLEREGFPVAAEDAHLRLGWDVMVDAIDRTRWSDVELETLRGSWSSATGPVLPAAATPFFQVHRVVAAGPVTPALEPAFTIGLVMAGQGVVRAEGGELPIRTGEAFAVPAAAIPSLHIEPSAALDLLLCHGVAPDVP